MTGFRTGYESVSRTSTSTRAVAAGLFTPRTVRIVGKAKVGHRLTIATKDWHPSPVFSYRWYANGHQIRHAGGRTLKITKSLRGKRITARLTARGYAYLPASVVTRTMRVR